MKIYNLVIWRGFVRLFGAVLLGCLAVGCGVCRRAETKVESRDSVTVVVRDSIIVRRDTVTITLPQETEKVVTPEQHSHLENTVAESDASVDTLGLLHHSLKTKKSFVSPVEVTEQVRDSIVYITRSEVKEIPVKREFTKWERFRLNSWWWLSAILLVVIAIPIVRIMVKVK